MSRRVRVYRHPGTITLTDLPPAVLSGWYWGFVFPPEGFHGEHGPYDTEAEAIEASSYASEALDQEVEGT